MTGGFGPESRGAWCNDSSPGAVARLGRSGFDWVCLDAQHGTYGRSELVEAARSFPGDVAELAVRVAANDFAGIGAALDVGATTVIVPQVDSPAEAARAVAATFYPPRGRRSWGQIVRTWGGGVDRAGAGERPDHLRGDDRVGGRAGPGRGDRRCARSRLPVRRAVRPLAHPRARPSTPCWTTTRPVRRWPGSPPRRPTRESSSAPSPASRRTPPGSPLTASPASPSPPTSGCSRPARRPPWIDCGLSLSKSTAAPSTGSGRRAVSGVASAGRGPGCRRARCARRSAAPWSARAGRRRCRSAGGRPGGRG